MGKGHIAYLLLRLLQFLKLSIVNMTLLRFFLFLFLHEDFPLAPIPASLFVLTLILLLSLLS